MVVVTATVSPESSSNFSTAAAAFDLSSSDAPSGTLCAMLNVVEPEDPMKLVFRNGTSPKVNSNTKNAATKVITGRF